MARSKTVEEYLQQVKDEAVERRNARIQDAVLRGWLRVMPAFDFFKAMASPDFSPMEDAYLCETNDDLEDYGERVAKQYSEWIHGNVA